VEGSSNSDTSTPMSAFVQKNLRWNFSVNLWDIAFITISLSLVSRETVMPVLVSQLTDSKLAIGLIPAIYTLGFYLPQLLSANFTERLRYKKPITMHLGGWGERLPYGLIALVLFFLATSNPPLTLVFFFALLATAAISSGLATPPWFDMIAKVIPVDKRGIWAGVGHGLGAVMGIFGAYFVGRILGDYLFPNNFALLFALSFLFAVISFIGLALNREPPSETVKKHIPLSGYLKQLPAILRHQPNYRRFIISRSIILLGTMATGFYMVYGTERFATENASVAKLTALLTGVLIGSQAVTNLIWGFIGDKKGHKIVLVGAAFILALAALTAFFASSQSWLVVTFILLGTFLAAEQVSGLNIILEFCNPEDRPTFIGLTNTLLAPLFALAPILGGWLATVFDFQTLFICASLAAVLGGISLSLWVKEPRAVSKT
jgi:MFS family permease